jgi:hypothetical protein
MQIKVIRAFRHDGKVFEPGKAATVPDALGRELVSYGKAVKVEARAEPKKDDKSDESKESK